MAEHTKGELKLNRGRNRHYEPDSGCYGDYELLRQTCFYICGPESDSHFIADIIVPQTPTGKADANHLILCWNSHDALLAACEKASSALSICIRFLLGTGQQPEPDEMANAIIDIDAAIAKAQPRQSVSPKISEGSR